MALRSPALYMGNPAVNHTAQNDRLSKAGLLRAETGQTAASRPLTAISGVLAGPPGTMGEVTLLSNTQFTVNPARWYLMSSDTPLGGVYEATNDAVETLAITAQDATQYRKAYFGVWVIDSFVAGTGDDQPHWGLQNGPLAASNPQLPAAGTLPENFLALGEFLIPPTGQNVTYTAYNLRTGLRGSLLPVPSTDTRAGSQDGSYRDFPLKTTVLAGGPQRWNATAAAWQPASPIDFPYAALRTTTQQVTTAAGWFGMLLDVVDLDSHTGFNAARGGGTKDTRWTCPAGQGGIYAVEGGATVNGPQAGTQINSAIKKNGAFYGSTWAQMNQITNAAAIIGTVTGRKLMVLAPGDYVEVWGYYSGGIWATYVDANAGPWLNVERIR